jgi:hypothetical protein
MGGLVFLVGRTRYGTALTFVRWGCSLRSGDDPFRVRREECGGRIRNRCIGFLLSFLGRIGLLGIVCLLTRLFGGGLLGL